MKENIILRTPEQNFHNIPDFDYTPKYIDSLKSINYKNNNCRMAYIDETITKDINGTFLFIHGHPTWSYLWRHIIPIVLKSGYRVIAPDLPGFGRSDKPTDAQFYNFNTMRNSIIEFIEFLDLKNITLVLHEWGATLGLTIPLQMPDRIEGIICFNTWFANGTTHISESYKNWHNHNIENKDLNIRALMARTNRILSLAECNAYHSPFPEPQYKTSLYSLPKIFPYRQDGETGKILLESDLWLRNQFDGTAFFLFGMRDPLITSESMSLLSRSVKNSEPMLALNNAGHFSPEWAMEFSDELIANYKDISAKRRDKKLSNEKRK